MNTPGTNFSASLSASPADGAGGRLRPGAAFTLLELVIVMAVVGIMLAVTAPNLARFLHGRNVREDARRLVAVTRRAAAVAASQSCRTVVWIDPTNGEYGWRRLESFTKDTTDELSYTVLDGTTLSVSPAPEEETSEVTFRPDGEVDGAEGLVVTFSTGSGGDEARVTFDDERGLFAVDEEGEDK
jgi:type II secretion system protein H